MSTNVLYLTILTIVIVSYAFDQWLDYLNLRTLRQEIPDEVKDFYDTDRYTTSIQYQRDQTRFSFVSAGFSFLVSMAMLAGGGFGWVDQLLRPFIHQEIPLALAFFGVIMIASDLASLPFQWYSIFVLEERYGFNKTSPKTFIIDKVKGYVLGAVIGGALLSVLIYFIQILGSNFWIWFGVVAAIFILLMNMFYTSLFLPLFNKLTPLSDGTLKSEIQAFAQKVNFPAKQILVMDGSKRSNKANAFFSGIGKQKKIVLYDTLIASHSTEELVAVFAHEVGHYKKKHIVTSYLISIIQIFFMLWILSLMISSSELSAALGGQQQAIHLNLIAFGILFSPLSGITGLLMSLISRKNEYEADAYAKENYSGAALANALKKLSVDTLSNLYPHPWYVFFHYSHPTLLQRLRALS